MAVRVISLETYGPAANLAHEAALFDGLRGTGESACLFYVNDPCIVLGRNNQAEEWVDLAVAAADGIPVLRRQSGGGTVYHDPNVLNYCFIAPRGRVDELCQDVARDGLASNYIALFLHLIVKALTQGGIALTPARTSDLNLNGRKLSGNAQRIARDLVLHHGTLMRACPLVAIERYLPIPPDRPGIAHRDFITGLAEQGCACTRAELEDWLGAEFRASFG